MMFPQGSTIIVLLLLSVADHTLAVSKQTTLSTANIHGQTQDATHRAVRRLIVHSSGLSLRSRSLQELQGAEEQEANAPDEERDAVIETMQVMGFSPNGDTGRPGGLLFQVIHNSVYDGFEAGVYYTLSESGVAITFMESLGLSSGGGGTRNRARRNRRKLERCEAAKQQARNRAIQEVQEETVGEDASGAGIAIGVSDGPNLPEAAAKSFSRGYSLGVEFILNLAKLQVEFELPYDADGDNSDNGDNTDPPPAMEDGDNSDTGDADGDSSDITVTDESYPIIIEESDPDAPTDSDADGDNADPPPATDGDNSEQTEDDESSDGGEVTVTIDLRPDP